VDGIRVRTSSQAGLIGAGTSLIALIIFTSAFTAYMFTTDLCPSGQTLKVGQYTVVVNEKLDKVEFTQNSRAVTSYCRCTSGK
jgi:hypothetical protein